VSAFSIGSGGQVSGLLDVAAKPGGGPIDLGSTADASFLYVELGGTGMLGEYAINSEGSLTELGLVPAQPGMEGLMVV
jgi:hypothetical protein